MMSNIALKSSEAAGSAAPAPADSGDTGDTGAFDALLALQSMVGEDTVTEASGSACQRAARRGAAGTAR
jgi:hypothetical protein